ncbi:type II secretion system F family protein [Streptomyces sp. TR06-5]|uniref:type II secretion system F family protein n=1 Tax=unclassified Streptomyces TaxID=2593676 RepID=UPI00399FF1E9
MFLALWGQSVLPVLLGAAAVPVTARVLRARRARAAAADREDAVISLCTAAAGELRSGRHPGGALLAAGAGRWGREGAALLAAARFGGEVATALQRAARLPGAEGLRGAAACWQVSADRGAGLADGLDHVADALRAERDQREDVRAQLAGPRSTAAVLALLPGCGLLLGTAMGAEPLGVLLHTPAGLICLAVGGALEWAGSAWVNRLVRAAEEGS